MSKSKQNPEDESTESRVRTILSELLQVDENDITPLSKLQEDMSADSLDVVEFVMMAEEAFDIQIPDEKAEKIVTVQDAVKLIDRLTLAKV